MQFRTKLNILSPYHPAVTLLGLLPKGAENISTQKSVLMGALFIIVEHGSNYDGQSVGEWMNEHSDNGTLLLSAKKE